MTDMYIYNTSFHVSNNVRHPFLLWLKSVFISEAVSEGLFSEPMLTRILIEMSPDTTSYALQFRTNDLDRAREWDSTVGSDLKAVLHRKFGEQVLSFVTFMEVMKDGQPDL